MKYAGDKEKMKSMLSNDMAFRTVKRKTAEVLKTCAKLDVEFNSNAEVIDMCKAWEDQRKEDRKEGRKEGRKEERNEMIVSMYEEHIPVEQIARIAKTTVENVMKVVSSFAAV